MAKYFRTANWTSTETCELQEEVEKRLKTNYKHLNKEDFCWINEVIRRNSCIEWVVVLKNPPEAFYRRIERMHFKAYLVRRWERAQYPLRKVWMLYIVPR